MPVEHLKNCLRANNVILFALICNGFDLQGLNWPDYGSTIQVGCNCLLAQLLIVYTQDN